MDNPFDQFKQQVLEKSSSLSDRKQQYILDQYLKWEANKKEELGIDDSGSLLGAFSKDAQLPSETISGAVGNTYSGLTGTAALKKVISDGGQKYLIGKTKDERIAKAEAILEFGGVDQYLQAAPLQDLITDKESTELEEQTSLNKQLTRAIALFEGAGGPGGTGPIAKFFPGFVVSENTRDMRRATENVRAQYQKAISGATVSDAEVARLSRFLPTAGKTEQENLGDLKELQNGILVNQRIFELGKREGLTANEAFEKYGKQVFSEFGLPFPGGSSTNNVDSLIDKYWK